jgi:hypothetical protein
MFDPKSRYATSAPYSKRDRRGRAVAVVPVPPPPGDVLLGVHVLRQGERVDHLAFRYLDNPAGFWRIAEFNGAMLAEALTEQREIAIPAATPR